jgi:hypothetical protein
MMRKVVVSVVVVFLLFGSVVYAAANHGKFEGYNIVKMKSDGKELVVEDTPAINFKGRTMVPIYMLRQLGVEVVWNAEEYSVDVKIPSEGHYTKDDMDYIKFLVKTSDLYDSLESLGDTIKDLSQSYSLAFQGINFYNDTSQLQTAFNMLNQTINNYNKWVEIVEDHNKQFLVHGIKDNTLNEIMDKYWIALEYYKEADKHLFNFSSTLGESDFNSYLEASGNGFDTALSGMSIASSKSNEYYRKVQEY